MKLLEETIASAPEVGVEHVLIQDTAPAADHPVDGPETGPDLLWRSFALPIAGCPRVRVSRDGGLNYPARWERRLTSARPTEPAAVRVYGPDQRARVLLGDFDAKAAGETRAAADATAFAELVEACGGRTIVDRSRSGGRHVYVLWASPLPASALRPVVRALTALFPTLDPRPMLGVAQGCIRPPGASHPAGGHQQLVTPLQAALEAVRRPNGPDVWERLCERLSPQLNGAGEDLVDELDGLGTVFVDALGKCVLRPGGPRALGAAHERIARTGEYDPERYGSASEARQAVMVAAAARGHRFVDVVRRVETRAWAGLADLYARYGRPATSDTDALRRIRTALARDWHEAHRCATAGPKPHLQKTPGQDPKGGAVRRSHTRGKQHTPQGDPTVRWSQNATPTGANFPGAEACYPVLDYQSLRAWWSAVRAAERAEFNTRSGLSVRLVLRALAAAAQMRGGTGEVSFGCRSLALACGLDHSTVAAVLRQLRAHPDPLIELLVDKRGVHGDRYQLRVPIRYRATAEWRHWRAGRFGVHPAFRVLGPVAAFVYEELDVHARELGELRRAALVSSSAAAQALTDLVAHGLAERAPAGWRRGRAALATVADTLGVAEVIEALITRYRVERAAWRAVLRVVPPLTVAEILAHAPAAGDTLDDVPLPPEPPPEAGETAMELLWRELGAVPIQT